MRTAFFILLAVALWAGAPAPALASSDVQMALVLEKPEYKRSDPVQIRIKLQNKGKKPVYVNTRFHPGLKGVADQKREIFFEAQGPSGKPLESRFSYYPSGFPKTDYFVLLEPGGEALSERPFDLKQFFEFTEAGQYRITATYQNAFGKEIGLDALQEKLTAEAKLKITD